MPRNLIVCCDGTSNEFGATNTNVVRLVKVLDPDATGQVMFYDPGVGTLPQPGFVTGLGKRWSVLTGLAFGAGLSANVEAAYRFLMDEYEPGDRIFLFGFSRGAYTVRALAGVLHQFGLLHRSGDGLVPYVLKMARSVEDLDDAEDAAKQRYWSVCRDFGETFARPDATSGFGPSPLLVHFLGVWDTVSSVGWVWDPTRFAFTTRNPGIEYVRHAISIDEHRAFFRQNRFLPSKSAPDQDIDEQWFPGCHCDVGGGYPPVDTGIWQAPFRWIVDEARAAGLAVSDARLAAVLRPPAGAATGWPDVIDDSLRWFWVPAEFFPKLGGDSREPFLSRLRFNLFRRRTVQPGARIHRAALERMRRDDLHYRPLQFSDAFVQRVRGLTEIPRFLAYDAT
jgi:uncharacterized protein (DUF2235 family)